MKVSYWKDSQEVSVTTNSPITFTGQFALVLVSRGVLQIPLDKLSQIEIK